MLRKRRTSESESECNVNTNKTNGRKKIKSYESAKQIKSES